MTRRHLWIALAVITVLASGLRLHRLADPSVWGDELFQIRDALHFTALDFETGYLPTRVALALRGFDVSELPATGYAVWREAGLDEWEMRIGTALVGCASIPLLAWLCAGFLGLEAACLLALLLAVSTWHLEWSQNARFYVPMFLYYNGALALYFAWVREPRPWRLAAALVLALCAVWTKPTALMLFGVIGIDQAVALLRERRLTLTTAQAAVLAAGALLCAAAIVFDGSVSAPSELQPFTDRRPSQSPLRVVLGNAFRVGAPTLVFAGVGAWVLVRSTDGQRRRLGVFLVAAVAIPLLCFGALALFFHTEIRYTFVNLFGWLALAAVGLALVTRELAARAGPVVAAAPLVLVVALAGLEALVYFESGYGFRSRYREAFRYVAEHRDPEEAVYAVDPWAGLYYLGDPAVQGERQFGESPHSAPEWLVVHSQQVEIDEARPHYLDGRALLRAVFPTRVAYPQYTVRVYRSPGGE